MILKISAIYLVFYENIRLLISNNCKKGYTKLKDLLYKIKY